MTETERLFAALGLRDAAEKVGQGLGPDAWLAYAQHVNTPADRFLYCLANCFIQSPPTKDEAFQLAEVFDHLGQPFAASATAPGMRRTLPPDTESQPNSRRFAAASPVGRFGRPPRRDLTATQFALNYFVRPESVPPRSSRSVALIRSASPNAFRTLSRRGRYRTEMDSSWACRRVPSWL